MEALQLEDIVQIIISIVSMDWQAVYNWYYG